MFALDVRDRDLSAAEQTIEPHPATLVRHAPRVRNLVKNDLEFTLRYLDEPVRGRSKMNAPLERGVLHATGRISEFVDVVGWRGRQGNSIPNPVGFRPVNSPHEYVVRGKTVSEDDWKTFVSAIDRDGVWRSWSPPDAPEVVRRYRYLVVGEYRYWRFDTILNRCEESRP